MQILSSPLKRKTYMLQCRVGKRNGVAAVRMATEMFAEN